MTQQDILTRWSSLSSATVHEASGKVGALPATIKPLGPHVKVAGRALPVKCPAGDNLFLHRAIYAAEAGEVLVVDTGEGVAYGYWGEVMAVAAQVRGIAGLITTGGVRDSQRMVEMGFPVCAAAVAIKGTGKDPNKDGRIGEPITIGDITIERGDYVLGDADGVVVIPAARLEAVIAESERRDAEEQDIFARLKAGDTTLSIYGLPAGEASDARA